MRAEYDFSKGVRGKYAKRFWREEISYCWILMCWFIPRLETVMTRNGLSRPDRAARVKRPVIRPFFLSCGSNTAEADGSLGENLSASSLA